MAHGTIHGTAGISRADGDALRQDRRSVCRRQAPTVQCFCKKFCAWLRNISSLYAYTLAFLLHSIFL